MSSVNSTVTYQYPPSLLTWRPDDETVYVILVAALVTLISASFLSVIHDIIFSTNPKGKGSVSDMALFLITSSSSPSFVFNTISPNKFNWRSLKTQTWASSRITLKLCILFVIAPAINIAAILLTTEFDRELSFADVGFGGLALGVDLNASTGNPDSILTSIRKKPIQPTWHDNTLVSFYLSEIFPMNWKGFAPLNGSDPTISRLGCSEEEAKEVTATGHYCAAIELGAFPIGVLIEITGKNYSSLDNIGVVLVVDGHEGVYAVGISMDAEDVQAVARIGSGLLAGYCNGKVVGGSMTVDHEARHEAQVRAIVSCKDDVDLNKVKNVLDVMKSKFVFVEDKSLTIIESTRGEEGVAYHRRDASELPFLRRRKSLVSVPVLAIVLLVGVCSWLFVSIVSSNDISLGIELGMKAFLNVPRYHNLLTKGKILLNLDADSGFLEISRLEHEKDSTRREERSLAEEG